MPPEDNADEEQANANLLKEFEGAAAEGETLAPASADEDESPVLAIDAEELEDDSASGPPDRDEDGRTPRQQKRANRYKEQVTAREAAESSLRAAEQRAEDLQRQLGEANARAQRPPPQPAQPAGESQIDAAYRVQQEVNDAYVAEASSLQAQNKEMTEATKAEFVKRARKAADGISQAQFQQNIAAYQQKNQGRQQIQMLAGQYPELYQDPKKLDLVRAKFYELKAEGKADLREAHRLVAEGPPAARATDRQRQQFGGAPTGHRSPSKKGPANIKMTPHMREIADEMYAHLPEKERYAKWVREHGEEFASMESSSGR